MYSVNKKFIYFFIQLIFKFIKLVFINILRNFKNSRVKFFDEKKRKSWAL